MFESCGPAPAADEITAAYANGRLTVVARGTTPETCWEVLVSRSPLDVWPPEFNLVACRVSEICIPVLTPYVARGRFEFGTAPDEITVHDEAGPHSVRVITPDEATPVGAASEAQGTSLSLSLAEALISAAQGVPPGPGDTGRAVRIKDIWYTDGGIVGPALHVSVEDMTKRRD